MNAAQAVAAGLSALPKVGRAFASTQAAWRFFNNARVTLPALAEPMRDVARGALSESDGDYALLVHDWSKLSFMRHTSKTDQTRISNSEDIGYEMFVGLLVDATNGSPLAPMEVELLSAKGVHTTRSTKLGTAQHHLRQVLPMMQASRTWRLPKTVVHVIDREADALAHFREWSADGHLFLVRCDDTRRVLFRGEKYPMPDIVAKLRREGAFRESREVEIRGKKGRQFVAEASVILDQPARVRTKRGRKKIPGPPLTLRLIVVQVRDENGRVIAQWLLLTNVPPDVSAEQIALWYYWRWRIESFFKLLKSAGQQLEHWQQESAEAIARRLLVSAMACVTVWQLQRNQSPAAVECQKILVRLSGRQTKRKRPVTAPALLAGFHVLLSMLDLLEQYTPQQLRRLTREAIPFLALTG